MQTNKALVILFLSSAAILTPALAQTSGTTMTDRGPVPSAVNTNGGTQLVRGITNTVAIPKTTPTANTDQILILSNFPGNSFVVLAAADSLLEVRIGEMAQTNSSNFQIQQFGQTLIADHTKSYNDAKAVADSMGITLRPLNNQEQGIVQRFESLSGDAFDHVFTRYLIQAHIQDIGRNEVAAERASQRSVRVYAVDNLPVLVGHLTTLLNIRESLLGNQPLSQ
jgi:predicted outer membrane protein